MSTEDPMTESD